MARLNDIPGAKEWYPEAKRNGIDYDVYRQRILDLGYPPEAAATIPLSERGRPRNPESIRQKCKAAGVNRRTVHTWRKRHPEMTVDEIIGHLLQAKKDRETKR